VTTIPPQPAGALEGIRVLEVASFITGPYASMLLADQGAEVVKVEEPSSGDPFRTWDGGDYATTFLAFNRNKRSLTLNLKSSEGLAIFLQLTADADVVIENFRPGVADALGIGYAAVSATNPRAVYCSITGFGDDGPYRDLPGYDTVGQALSGLLSLVSDLDAPSIPGVSFADNVTGMSACYAILSALVARQRTNEGQHVSTSLLQATGSFLQEAVSRYLGHGVVPLQSTRARAALVFAFVAQDGQPFIVHLSSPVKFWESLTDAIAMPELRADPRFRERAGRIEHYDALHDTLAERFGTQSRTAWIDALRAHDVPAAPLNTVAEMLNDPQVRHLGLRIAIDHPTRGPVALAGGPVIMDGTPVTYRTAPPTLGQHTGDVLNELGYGAAAVERLRADGVV
jgi:crotonobetainyl-CoA:carnitine CoA-transferase CaiB-like acyl-CoA transferase